MQGSQNACPATKQGKILMWQNKHKKEAVIQENCAVYNNNNTSLCDTRK